MQRSEACQEKTKLVVFLGTPHRGSSFSNWSQIAANLARLASQDSNNRIVESLEVNDEVLDNIYESFNIIVYKEAIKIHSFQEAKGITGMRGVHEKVSRTSFPYRMLGSSCLLATEYQHDGMAKPILRKVELTGRRRSLLQVGSSSRYRNGREHRREPHANDKVRER